MTDMTMLYEQENPLIKRKELILRLPYPSKVTPKNEEVVQIVSKFLKKDTSHIAVKKVAPVYGKHEAVVTAFVYEDPVDLQRFEVIKKKTKKQEQKAALEQKKA